LSQNFHPEFVGRGTIVIEETAPELLQGTIGDDGWSLALHGSRSYSAPMQVRFQGKGLVGGELWVYDYIGWLVPVWPNSDAALQRPAIAGSVMRTVPHLLRAAVPRPPALSPRFTPCVLNKR
jgi:hypothetical protein